MRLLQRMYDAVTGKPPAPADGASPEPASPSAPSYASVEPTRGSFGEVWPSPDDRDRLDGYDSNFRLFIGDHQSVFEPNWPAEEDQYVIVNLLGPVSKLLAHRLVGTPPKARPLAMADAAKTGTEIDPLLQSQAGVLDDICRWSRWPELLMASETGCSYRGDTVLKASYDAKKDHVRITEVLPSRFFPTYSGDDADEMTDCSIVFEVADPEYEQKVQAFLYSGGRISEWTGAVSAYFFEERHTPGLIERNLYKAERSAMSSLWRREKVNLTTLPQFAELEEKQPTGIDEIPIVHLPNGVVAETKPWGQSDYIDLEPIQRAINRRRSSVGKILNKYEELMLAADRSLGDAEGNFDASIKFIPLVQDETPPFFISYPGDASGSSAEADTLQLLLCMAAMVSPETLGIGGEGPAESARAIKLRQNLTTSTVEGKRTVADPRLRHILSIAMKLWAVHGVEGEKPVALEPDEIGLQWSDGLPWDEMEAIQAASIIVTSGLPETRAELKARMKPELTEEQIAALLEQYQAEQEAANALLMGTPALGEVGSTEIAEEGNIMPEGAPVE